MFRRVLTIARKELRQRARDRSAALLVVVAPLLIAGIMSGALSGTENFHYRLGVVNEDHGAAAAAMLRTLHQPALHGVIQLVELDDRTIAAHEVASGTLGAALVIPAGFTSSLRSAAPVRLEALTSVNDSLAASTTVAIARTFTAQLDADRLSVLAAVAAGAPRSQLAALEHRVVRWRLPLGVVRTPAGAHPLTAISYFAPAMAIFFLLFQVTFTARSFFVDLATGMVDRMLVAPVRPTELLAGKALAAFTFCLASLTIVAVTTSELFGASWGAPLPVALVAVGMSLVVACLAVLVIVTARSQRQAEGFGSLVAFTLALVGGNFVMVASAPPLLRHLALWTPNGWALRALTDLSTVGGGIGQVALPLLVLGGFALAIASVAALLAPRVVRR